MPDNIDGQPIHVSIETAYEQVKQQRNVALDEAAQWKAAYIDSQRNAQENINLLQQEIIRLQSAAVLAGHTSAEVIDMPVTAEGGPLPVENVVNDVFPIANEPLETADDGRDVPAPNRKDKAVAGR